jgi:hypothetical protein
MKLQLYVAIFLQTAKQEFKTVSSFKNHYSIDFLSQSLFWRGFTLTSYVNRQNTSNKYWNTENPHAVHEVPLHDLNVGVWSALGAYRINGPVFFHETLNPEYSVRFILSPFSQLW